MCVHRKWILGCVEGLCFRQADSQYWHGQIVDFWSQHYGRFLHIESNHSYLMRLSRFITMNRFRLVEFPD